MLQPDFSNSTGGQLSTITRSDAAENKRIYEALPKETKDLFSPKLFRFSGALGENGKQFLKEVESFMVVNSFELCPCLDFLLVDQAKDMWTRFKETVKPNDKQAKEWFQSKFNKPKSILQLIEDFGNIKQGETERFECFVVRVNTAVKTLFHSGLSDEDISNEVIKSRVDSEKLRDTFAMKPKISTTEMELLAENFEKSREAPSAAVQKISYAQATKQNAYTKRSAHHHPTEKKYHSKQKEHSAQPSPIMKSVNRAMHKHPTEPRKRPSVSMMFIAKKVYNKAKGLPPPKEEVLKHGDCFCCGSHGHFRKECPMNGRCLICGKSGHNFTRCYSLPKQKPNVHNIRCIEEQTDDYTDEVEDVDSEIQEVHPLNTRGATVEISSVGYSQ